MNNARHCEGERKVEPLFALQTVYRLFLEPEQEVPLIKLSESLK